MVFLYYHDIGDNVSNIMKGAEKTMAVKFNLRLCLQLMDQGISLNTISKQYHISKHTSSKVKRRKEELEFDTAKLECYSDTELGKLFFPNLYESVSTEIDTVSKIIKH